MQRFGMGHLGNFGRSQGDELLLAPSCSREPVRFNGLEMESRQVSQKLLINV